MTISTCEKCGGTGCIPQFSHVEGGECFDCGGSGVSETKRAVRVVPNRNTLRYTLAVYDEEAHTWSAGVTTAAELDLKHFRKVARAIDTCHDLRRAWQVIDTTTNAPVRGWRHSRAVP